MGIAGADQRAGERSLMGCWVSSNQRGAVPINSVTIFALDEDLLETPWQGRLYISIGSAFEKRCQAAGQR